MIGIYLSGTGNTKHCIEKLAYLMDSKSKTIPLEDDNVIEEIKKNDTVILGYPVQYSNSPFMVRDFIRRNSMIWKDKKVICVATMGAFSGDGAGCSARLLKKYGAIILGGLHIHMPDSVCDVKLLKKTVEKNKKIVIKADKKIEKTAEAIKRGIYPQEGINILYHIAGLLAQRLWFYGKTKGYSDKIKISNDCVGCGVCSMSCPMKNITIKNKKAVAEDRCTMCYRCISLCPQKAITLLGKEVHEQCRFEKYI
ncbi:EFR1 family ferrodoxin [Clostridium butyricum]|uniref:EFR1 family ferrodoxin n=1 Tax=Clostridium butyricum TaxID=1492 RepID=UPI001BAA775D|nr:EFR1 family ferrodoxin [Clostridium butyricum]QUF84830.1 EFR1 family ferrodoxin [Clostridium butyricum]